ncbi:MAG: DivIVA domain-containing protein [Oscillospiraceae bacterium]|nr:DivIVA domain-containing protein [Oscillospiraceae bacterium]
MLTPQEVQDKKFEKAVFGGYDMAAVDDFLEQVTEDYAALYKENAVLKSKLKVLVNTVEEYRSVDESMRKTLLSAQRMAEESVAEAKSQADVILRKARHEADTLTQRLRGENENEMRRHHMLHEQTVRFAAQLVEMYRQQAELAQTVPSMIFEVQPSAAPPPAAPPVAPPAAPEAAEAPPPSAPAAPGEGVEEPVVQEILFAPGGTLPEENPEEDTVVPRPRFEFPNIQHQFGQQYAGHGDTRDRP